MGPKHKKKKTKTADIGNQRAPKSISEKPDSNNLWIWVAAILLLTLVAFYPSFSCGWTNWDDNTYVLENPNLGKPGPATINYFFTHTYFLNYHPLTMLSYALDYHFAKLEPGLYHKENVFFHLLNATLVFLFIYRLSGKKKETAFFVSALFAIHPMHVESITWISERKDVLYTLFFISSLLTYLSYLGTKKYKYLVFCFLLFFLSLLSKPAAVVLPVVLMLLDFYKGQAIGFRNMLEKIPFFILALIFGITAFRIQATESIASYEVFTLWQRIMFGCYGCIVYVYKLFLPVDLSSFYPYPFTDEQGGIPLFFSLAPIFVLLAAGFVLYLAWKQKNRLIFFGTGFYFVTIVLVLQFLSVGQVIMAERYSYVPYIGLLFILGTLLQRLVDEKPQLKIISAACVSGVILIFSYITHERTKVWTDTGTLWTDVIEKYPFPPWPIEVAYENRGNYYAKEQNQLDEGLADYNVLISMKTKNHKIYSNLGNIYGLKGQEFEKAGQKEKAAEMYRKSVESFTSSAKLDSLDSKTFVNRAITYTFMGRHDLAAVDFDKALQITPGDMLILEKRAYARYMSGSPQGAIDDYNKLISANPENTNLFLHRGIAKFNLKLYGEAIKDFSTLTEKNPKNGNAFFNLSVSYSRLGDKMNAVKFLKKAQDLGYPVDKNYLTELGEK